MSVPYFRSLLPGCDLHCLDVSARSLAIGAARFPGQASFVEFDGGSLPFGDSLFDIVFAACVFHHVDHAEHPAVLREFHRVLAPGGIAVVFEHNPYNPLTRRAIDACVFDRNARLIRAGALQRGFAQRGSPPRTGGTASFFRGPSPRCAGSNAR